MQRRAFIALLGGMAAASPLAGRAQRNKRTGRIGVLQGLDENDPEARLRIAAFTQGLRQLGWREGFEVAIDCRWGRGDLERTQEYAAELIGLQPDVIWAGGPLPLQSLKRTTATIPIVFTAVFDPIGAGFVASLTKPGGNITGFTLGEFSMGGKMLDILRETAPGIKRVAVVLSADQSPNVALLRAIETTAPAFGIGLTATDVQKGPDEIERSLAAFAQMPDGGMIVLPSAATIVHRDLVMGLAARLRLPAAYGYRFFVTDGGLVSYGIDTAEQSRQAAGYIDRILRGEKPANLPVQQPTKFELAINLKTAKALGLNISATMLANADEVIE
jgi:putative tryptophan/tyrosine transport system substrate-binding protein